jgi:hypothetical protein
VPARIVIRPGAAMLMIHYYCPVDLRTPYENDVGDPWKVKKKKTEQGKTQLRKWSG